ncbi:hypothetical protein [Arthrobacter sp. ISL-72]|uniref:hypothetical protein n=1 Tax=Arthrobacter sp. ISL-72 TaxID=2819114 RepID=UPI0020356127|nr:hypothetical protein [Arthrobacter sp. ISL-72]
MPAVELAVEDRYYLQEQITYPTWAETRATWQSDIDANRHYSFLWCPDDGSCELLDLPGSFGARTGWPPLRPSRT